MRLLAYDIYIDILRFVKVEQHFHLPKIYLGLFFFQLLAASDLIVVLGGALLWGLPDLWHYYSLRLYPIIVPYVLPIMQIAMMISIYTTILMSFERYVRIGHTCRLKDCAYITDDNFK